MNHYYVYILTNRYHGILYTGVTNNLLRRVYEHKSHITKGFTYRYDLQRLVYYECHCEIHYAIAREKRIKKWRREWKITLIEADNPDWKDLYRDISGEVPG